MKRKQSQIDFRALVDAVCECQPGADCESAYVLDLYLEKRALRDLSPSETNWTDVHIRDEMGDEFAALDLSDDDVDYLVERLTSYIDETPLPTPAAIGLLDWVRGDERRVQPAIRLLQRSLHPGANSSTESNGNGALAVLMQYQHWPEVLDAIRLAAEFGESHVGELARGIIERAQRLADPAAREIEESSSED